MNRGTEQELEAEQYQGSLPVGDGQAFGGLACCPVYKFVHAALFLDAGTLGMWDPLERLYNLFPNLEPRRVRRCVSDEVL